MLAAPALLAISALTGAYWLAMVVLFVVLPLLRGVYGDTHCRQSDWSEVVATLLDALPIVYMVALAGSLIVVGAELRATPPSLGGWVAMGCSMWATFAFGSCVAHELLHHPRAGHRLAGRVVAGMIGYPFLEHEHRTHHGSVADSDAPEWPRVQESIYAFTARRSLHVVRTAWNSNLAAAERRGRRYTGGLGTAVLTWSLCLACFGWALGWPGATTYLAVSIAVHWAIQAITYIQHWGLGRDNVATSHLRPYAWEDTCRLQRWLTLGISFHFAHHRNAAIPYYRLLPVPDSPRMPASYVVLLYVSLVPPLWRRLMIPALERWKHAPQEQRSAGRRLICFTT
jgi:alkane 1-monooxygenase